MSSAARLANLARVEAVVADMLASIRTGTAPITHAEATEPDTLTDTQADREYAADADYAAALIG